MNLVKMLMRCSQPKMLDIVALIIWILTAVIICRKYNCFPFLNSHLILSIKLGITIKLLQWHESWLPPYKFNHCSSNLMVKITDFWNQIAVSGNWEIFFAFVIKLITKPGSGWALICCLWLFHLVLIHITVAGIGSWAKMSFLWPFILYQL